MKTMMVKEMQEVSGGAAGYQIPKYYWEYYALGTYEDFMGGLHLSGYGQASKP